ncbi:MAG: efflux RND transporter periplasmic adaptor subunit [Anaerolineales bacterium]|uniref:efflux RND transporter periplasmic adaptor subunit n=1 Tax=Candidatus Villigracilis proximus TaxID=3140683 RepID=UPI003135D63C|nr:efflux RND transporter periplasmic adaptor subunit [Anaerolineales bacterium]
MKKFFWTVLLALTVTLAACSSAPTATPLPSAPVTASAPTGLILSGGVVASAEAVPAQDTQMSFLVSAPVQEVLVKEGDMVTAGQPLLTLYSLILELSVTSAELAVQSAELEHQYWILRNDRTPERRDRAKAELDGVIAKLETAKASFAQTTLIAPFDATVINIKIQPGEFAQAGQVVIVLGDLAHLQITTTDLSERDVPSVQVGQNANIYIEALDVTVTGKVIHISPVAETVGGDVVYPVTVELDEQPAGLLWGMSAEVEIVVE